LKPIIGSISATEKGADNLYKYTIWAINNINKVKKSYNATEREGWNSKTKFDNFEPRHYDWDTLEKRLLGWE